MNCSTTGFPVLHYIPEFAQTHVHWVADAIQSSHSLTPSFSSCPQSFLASGSFPMSLLFTSGSQIIEASASASNLPMNIQGWFPLGLTGLISLQSKGPSRVFSNTTIHIAFVMVQLSYSYMTTGKTIGLTIWTFVSKVMSWIIPSLYNQSVCCLQDSLNCPNSRNPSYF